MTKFLLCKAAARLFDLIGNNDDFILKRSLEQFTTNLLFLEEKLVKYPN
jgi:hypothetical protein